MAENNTPALEFVNDNGHLRYGEATIRVHGIIKELLHTSTLSIGKDVRIAFFYQNDSFDGVIPFCLEVLYQTNVIENNNRNHLLLYCGKNYSKFKENYKNVFYGFGNYCNHLFGLGVVSPRGTIKEEKKIYKHGGKTFKDCEDKFLFSSRYSFFPNEKIASKIAEVVIIPPSISSMHKIPQICQWCEKNEIKTITIFDPFPTARKIKFYGNLGFIPYGWGMNELETAYKNSSSSKISPISNPRRLHVLSDIGEIEYVKIPNKSINSSFNSLNKSLSKLHEKIERKTYDKDMLVEAASISRRLASLSCPLHQYDKEYFGSMFRKPLSIKVDNFISLIESTSLGEGTASDMRIAAYYIKEVKKKISDSNPKFNELVNLISKSISEGIKTLVLIPSEKEVNAFKKSLANLRIPITIDQLRNSDIIIKSFSVDRRTIENLKFDLSILSTYPFLDKKYLLTKSLADKIKIILYPCEISDYKFFNNLYKQIEEKFFTFDRRKEIDSFLSGKGSLKDIKISRIVRNGDNAETEIDYKQRKPKDIISVLTDIEKSLDVSAPSLFQESLSKSNLKKVSTGELKTPGISIKFNTGEELFVREEKTIQVLTASDDINFKLAGDLKVGETVVVINRDMRISLNELILEKAEEYPKLRVLQTMVSLWVNALTEGMSQEDDDEEKLLTKMNVLGANIKSKYTIKHWVNGEVIGPRDLKNILRIAKIYNCSSLENNARAVASSITQMRGLRKTLLKRAKNALFEGESKEIEKLGIDFSDFADAIEFFRITSIKKLEEIQIEILDKIGGTYEI